MDWAKKPGKMTTIKFVKDPKVPRDDIYKSSTVHVPEGLSPNSESRPTPRGRSTAKQAYPTQQYPQQSYGAKPRTSTAGRSPQGRQPNGFPQVVQQPQVMQQARVPVSQTSTNPSTASASSTANATPCASSATSTNLPCHLRFPGSNVW